MQAFKSWNFQWAVLLISVTNEAGIGKLTEYDFLHLHLESPLPTRC